MQHCSGTKLPVNIMDAPWLKTVDTWPLIRDSDGRVLDEYSLRKMTFFKGISPDVRPEVWLFLLGYYPFSSTWEERKEIDTNKRSQYEALLSTWKSPTFVPDHNFLKYERVIEKDCLRTDRHLDFYSENSTNVDKLRRILSSFVVYDPEFGYVQGMNDILSMLLYVLESEHKAFWCFTDITRRMHSTFSDLTLSQPLAAVARLCHYVSPQLHDHISAVYDGEDWIFCYRWILINFKREFCTAEILCLWERIWSNHATAHFELFFATAVLLHFRQDLRQCCTVEDFMELTMKLSGNIPFRPVLSMAQALLDQLKKDEYCPYELTYLLSSSKCAPPPRVGFVRARQSFITLHSNKISLQRNQIWKSLFGDAPVQPITSPFMLSPAATMNQSDYSKMTSPENSQTVTVVKDGVDRVKRDPDQLFQLSGKSLDHELNSAADTTVDCKPPPTVGFLPRESTIRFRDDIRNTQHMDHSGPTHIVQSHGFQQTVPSDVGGDLEQPTINGRYTLSEQNDSYLSNCYASFPSNTTCSQLQDSTTSVKSHQTWPLSISENINTYKSSQLEVDYKDLYLHTCELNFDSLRGEAELIPL